MKRLMSILQGVLADASTWCRTSSTRDLVTITRRVEHEGLSFLTITLPNFCKDFERSLDQKFVAPNSFAGFAKYKSLPRFLGGYLELVFDRKTGLLLDNPSSDAIFFIRQACLLCKKIRIECTKERTTRAFSKYVECDHEVDTWNNTIDSTYLDRFQDISARLWGPVLSELTLSLAEQYPIPKHGPGSTAEKILGNSKFSKMSWTYRLEEFFPSADFIIPNYGFYEDLQAINFVEPDAELATRVISVPKTLSTPRIIAMEPLCMQYTQQSILEPLIRTLESSNILGDAIGFTKQNPNQILACYGSKYGNLATLDLSEASDRVSKILVERMLNCVPLLRDMIFACRSTQANVPDQGKITLAKFASMGSALCFPMEAMVFLTLIAYSYENLLRRRLIAADFKILCDQVRVYGDDIIVPTYMVQEVMATLRLFGCKVNASKSFWTGKFRESCGRDYYDGNDVTVTYLRTMIPDSPSDASRFISFASTRNQFYKAGLWQTAAIMDNIWKGFAPQPVVGPESPVIGRHSFLGYLPEKYDVHLHRPMVKGYMQRSKLKACKLSGTYALQKFFLKRGTQPIFDAKHLERSGRPDHVDTKFGWGVAY
jgi:hypothetical protein